MTARHTSYYNLLDALKTPGCALCTLAKTAVSHLTQRPSTAPLAARLQDLQEWLTTGRFHLAVLGQFKRGKSTLLNALLGEPFLPTAVVPLTAFPL